MTQRTILTFGLALLTILTAVGLQWFRMRDIKEGDRVSAVRPSNLARQLPTSLGGWPGRDEALGPNEVARSAVERVLNYDDYVYRIYERGGRRIGIYAAYWSAGRMPLQKVASHTPDRCWTENGWQCEEMRHAESLRTGNLVLRPAQWRSFRPPAASGQREYVLYWHRVGDRLYDYGDRFNNRPGIVQWWRDTVLYAFAGSEEQYFIRVTSNRPFEELSGEPAWRELLESLARLGLAVDYRVTEG